MFQYSGKFTPEQFKIFDDHFRPRNEAFEKLNLQGKARTRWNYQRYIKNYLRCVKAVDENVGRLLEYLDDNGLANNTVVIYSSDQGFWLGEHGWFDKRWMYEESLHTPLIVAGPAKSNPTPPIPISFPISTSPRPSSISLAPNNPATCRALPSRRCFAEKRRPTGAKLITITTTKPADTVCPCTTVSPTVDTNSYVSPTTPLMLGNFSI